MKVVILAGGYGTRISEETVARPKPMVEIGGKPILWHIMKTYSHHGLTDFIICAGYKGFMIKQYFANYFLHMSDVTFDVANNSMEVHSNKSEPWRITVIDTGENTQTGGRLKRVQPHVGDEPFCLTYGDGVSDVDIGALLRFHDGHDSLATVTAVRPPGRFGVLNIEQSRIVEFREKPEGEAGWISGGYFVLSPKVFDYIGGDQTIWEREPMERLAAEGNLAAYQHRGFWRPMDTLRDKIALEDLWERNEAPWQVW